MRRWLVTATLALAALLAAPAAALAHDQPESKQSNWIMADWMLETFFLFAGVALFAFLLAWVRQYRSTRQIPGISPLDSWAGYTTEAAGPATTLFFLFTGVIFVFGAVMVVGHLISGQKF
jgi:hypothetical protein